MRSQTSEKPLRVWRAAKGALCGSEEVDEQPDAEGDSGEEGEEELDDRAESDRLIDPQLDDHAVVGSLSRVYSAR